MLLSDISPVGVLMMQKKSSAYNISHKCSAGLRAVDCDNHIMWFLSFVFSWNHSVIPHSLWIGWVILKDTTPVKLELFHHRINVISQENLIDFQLLFSLLWPKPYQYLHSVIKLPGSYTVWVKLSDLRCFHGNMISWERNMILSSLHLTTDAFFSPLLSFSNKD